MKSHIGKKRDDDLKGNKVRVAKLRLEGKTIVNSLTGVVYSLEDAKRLVEAGLIECNDQQILNIILEKT